MKHLGTVEPIKLDVSANIFGTSTCLGLGLRNGMLMYIHLQTRVWGKSAEGKQLDGKHFDSSAIKSN